MALTEADPALRSEPARTQAAAQLDLRKITTPILLHLLRGTVPVAVPGEMQIDGQPVQENH